MLGRYNLLISENSRVCNEHLQEDLWHELAIQQNNISEFTAAHIVRALSILTTHVTTDVLNFDEYQTISPKEFHTWTGLTHDQYTDLLTNTPSLNDRRNKNVILAAVLVKLRTGDSNARLATIFRTSESSFARMIKTGRIALMQDFVPLHLGFDHLSREDVARRNLTVPGNLFGNPDSPPNERKAITICDGTYIYIQKSSNYFFQRKSYSNHKYRNLLKPFLFVCCDGHIIEVSGPHAATTSDAQVMNNVIDNDEDNGDGVFHWFYKNGDVFILDRGFRDAVVPIQQHGYSVHIPESKHPNETQLTTEQANKSRLITICRWVVEVVNGRFKRDFRLLRNIYINKTLYYMFDFFKIAAALINAYHKVIDDNIHAQTFLNIINERLNLTNILADIVIRHNYNRRRVQFRSLSADVPELNDFPRLTEEDLVLFSLGIYQIKQARSYYGEHLNPNGVFIIEIGSGLLTEHARELGENVVIIRGRIQSRHVRARKYYVYIGWNTRLSGREAIAHYYCTCNVGKRTVGCCSHTMCLVWYMSFARHELHISPPAIGLENVMVRSTEI